MPSASNVVTDPSGNATVGCPSGAAPTVLKTFNVSGTVAQSRPLGYPRPDVCAQKVAVGKDGTAYVFAHTSFSPLIQAYKNNQLVWEYSPGCGPYLYPVAMVIAPNENLYLHVTQGIGGCNGDMLIGLSLAAGTEVVKTSLPWDVRPGGLAAYANGLVLFRQSTLQYLTFAGTVQATYDHGSNGLNAYVEHFDATLAGRVFVGNKANSNATIGCLSPGNVTGSITAFDPSGPAWTAPLAGCTEVRDLRPNYRGGVVMHGHWHQALDQVRNNRLLAFSPTGQQMWLRDYQHEDNYSFSRIATDLNGNVAVRHYARIVATVNGSSYKFGEIRFALLSGNTGDVLPGTGLALRGDSTSTNGPSYQLVNDDIAIGKGVTYVVANACTDATQCDSANPKLYAFTVPGLEMDYPRGAILRYNEPWKQYVAMGDSFSSGQGVGPYQPGTDIEGPPQNRCRRSQHGAYSQLLNGSPSTRLSLTAFVACGGAETWHVINGRDTEGSQLDALSVDTDVVTITIGGNDIGFGPLGLACFLQLDCTQSQEYHFTVNVLANVLPGALDNLFAQMASRIGPQTRVLVVGYPLLIPDVSVPVAGPYCAYLFPNEKTAARQVINTLNQVLQDAADRAGHQFEFVDVNYEQSPFKGHELCNDGNYFHGTLSAEDERFHPNAAGQGAYEQIISRYL